MDKQQVDYELVVVDELPPRASHGGGGGGRSILNEQLEKIVGNEALHGKIVRIGLYTKGTAATAAKNVLQQRNGRTPHVKGWKFETRRVPRDPQNAEAGTDMGLFAIYTPGEITAKALEEHLEYERKRKQKLVEARAERENGEGGGGGEPGDGDDEVPDDDADPDPDDYLDDDEVGEDEDEEPFE